MKCEKCNVINGEEHGQSPHAFKIIIEIQACCICGINVCQHCGFFNAYNDNLDYCMPCYVEIKTGEKIKGHQQPED